MSTTTQLAFDQYTATSKLRELARHPFDLTAPRNLTPERLARFSTEAVGIKFLYGTERITEEVMETLGKLAEEARVHHKMEEMQAGDVINKIEGFPSEERRVLHTALRDFFDSPNPSPAAREATAKARAEADKLDAFMQKIDEEGEFNTLIMIGIGGSYLGPEACYLALEHLKKPMRNVFFISNVDPDNTADILNNVNLSTTLVVTVSKSGTTLETQTNEELVKARLEKEGLKPRKHMIAITGEESPMNDKRKYLECFYIWDWVGGRYSVTSMVGGVLLAFAFGFDVYWEFLRGCNAMDRVALNKDYKRNLPLLGALLGIWNHNFLNYPTVALIPYSYALRRFSAHIQQLDMESNGKHTDRKGIRVDFNTGPIYWGEPGTNAQHSFYQLIHQGTSIIPLEFIGFKLNQSGYDLDYSDTTSQEKLLSNLFAQMIALATGQKSDNPNKGFEGNRPSHLLLARRLTPSILGSILAYFEHKTAFQGFIWDINSFDQEGVQLGKVLAQRIIERFAHKRGIGPNEPYEIGDALMSHLETL